MSNQNTTMGRRLQTQVMKKDIEKIFSSINETENHDALQKISSEIFRDNLLDFIRTMDVEKFMDTVDLFIPLIIKIYDYIDKHENCDTVEIVDAFQDSDPELIGHSLDFLAGIDKIE